MSPLHFANICWAETRKLFSRLTAKLGLVTVAMLAVLTILIVLWIDNSGFGWTTTIGDTVTENTLGDRYDFEAADVLVSSLWPRNALFIGRLFLVALCAMSVASEFSSRTLREDVLRPVPRWAIPLAKLTALSVWASVSLAITFVFSLALAVPIFGIGGPWLNTLLAYGATWLGDIGLIAVAMLASFATRSVPGTIVALFLFWLINAVTGWVVWGAGKLLPMAAMFSPQDSAQFEYWGENVSTLQKWLPSSALELWTGYALDTPWAWQSLIVLVGMTGGSIALSAAIFSQQDVP